MRVLLVEDNSRLAAVISADLKTQAVLVDIAECGDDALHLMRIYDFDLVLLTLLLPDMEGSSLINRIRSAKHEDTDFSALCSPSGTAESASRRRR